MRLVLAALLVSSLAVPAAAQTTRPKVADPPKALTAPKRTNPKTRLARTPKRVIRLKGDIIEGRVQKPEAFYVLQRTGMTFEALELETRLTPKILQSLQKPPF